MVEIPYFIFTSGEDGLCGVDWGVKFASEQLGDPDKVDFSYRELCEKYKLFPSLERPKKDGVGIMVLPEERGFLFGLIFPYRDSQSQGYRPNISLLGCKISNKLIDKFKISPGQLAEFLINDKSVAEIARPIFEKDSSNKIRPSHITLEKLDILEHNHGSIGMEHWPDPSQGFLKVGKEIKMLKKSNLNKLNYSHDESFQNKKSRPKKAN